MSEIQHPFADKVSRNGFSAEREAEHIGHLGSENRDCDTAGETYHYRIRNKLDDCS